MRKPEQHSPHDPAEGINGRLVMNLRDISHTMRSLYEGRGSQRWVLIVLNETGTITQRELTQWLGIQPGSATAMGTERIPNAGRTSAAVTEAACPRKKRGMSSAGRPARPAGAAATTTASIAPTPAAGAGPRPWDNIFLVFPGKGRDKRTGSW